MAVLVSLLAPGCQTQPGWLQSPGSSHSSLHQSNGPAHLCLHWRLSSEGSWEQALTEETALKWALGHSERGSPDSHVLTVTSKVIESGMGWQRRGVRPLMKSNTEKSDWLSTCLWGECWRPSATQTLLYTQSHPCPYACAHLCMHTGVLFYSVDCQRFHTLKFQSKSK